MTGVFLETNRIESHHITKHLFVHVHFRCPRFARCHNTWFRGYYSFPWLPLYSIIILVVSYQSSGRFFPSRFRSDLCLNLRAISSTLIWPASASVSTPFSSLAWALRSSLASTSLFCGLIACLLFKSRARC
jgi:hypothetical protein